MRAVTDNDFDTVYDVYTDKNVYPFMAFDVHNKNEFKPVFKKMQERTYFWIFENETEPYGICTVTQDIGRSSHCAYLGSFGIKSTMQGKGYGREIIEKVEQSLKDNGYKTMFFYVESDNDKAIGFYKTLGFEQTGAIPKYFKRENDNDYIDELIFTKILN